MDYIDRLIAERTDRDLSQKRLVRLYTNHNKVMTISKKGVQSFQLKIL